MTIPVTILGGYLGAGKTTRVNEVLAASSESRIAVVVNDFGAVNVDADLVRSRSADTLELANGCICCSLADGMAPVMQRLAAMQPPPDHVLIEVSGVGDPGQVARWARLPGFALHGVVVCADAETVQERCADRWVGDTVRRQLAAADLVALTKTDLVPSERLESVGSWLAEVTTAPVVADLDFAGLLLDPPLPPTGAARQHSPHHAEHRSWSVELTGLADEEALRSLLSDLPDAVVRVKGVVRTRSDPGLRTVVHRVGRRVESYVDGPWPGPSHPSRLVVVAIGPDSGLTDLEHRLNGLLSGVVVP